MPPQWATGRRLTALFHPLGSCTLSSTLGRQLALLIACLSLFAPSQVEGQFTVSAATARACVSRPQVTLTALQNSAPLQVDWHLTPAFAGTLSPANGSSS